MDAFHVYILFVNRIIENLITHDMCISFVYYQHAACSRNYIPLVK